MLASHWAHRAPDRATASGPRPKHSRRRSGTLRRPIASSTYRRIGTREIVLPVPILAERTARIKNPVHRTIRNEANLSVSRGTEGPDRRNDIVNLCLQGRRYGEIVPRHYHARNSSGSARCGAQLAHQPKAGRDGLVAVDIVDRLLFARRHARQPLCNMGGAKRSPPATRFQALIVAIDTVRNVPRFRKSARATQRRRARAPAIPPWP